MWLIVHDIAYSDDETVGEPSRWLISPQDLELDCSLWFSRKGFVQSCPVSLHLNPFRALIISTFYIFLTAPLIWAAQHRIACRCYLHLCFLLMFWPAFHVCVQDVSATLGCTFGFFWWFNLYFMCVPQIVSAADCTSWFATSGCTLLALESADKFFLVLQLYVSATSGCTFRSF